MMITAKLLLAASLILAAPVLGAGAASAADTEKSARPASWYAATVADDAKGGFLMVHFWSKGPRFRSEAVLAGRQIVTIVNATTYTIIDTVSGTGVAIERSPEARALDERRGRPFGNELEQLLAQGGELVGTEEAEGKMLDVYRLTNSSGRRTIWVSTTNPPVPLRVQTYDRETSITGKVDYVNWLHNPFIADSFFKADPNLQIEQLGYDEYRRRIRKGPVGPAPVLYRHLLHGER